MFPKKKSFGSTIDKSTTNPTIKTIRSNSKAEESGLSVGDEIIAINGFRCDNYNIEEILNSFKENDKFTILISRDGILMDINAEIGIHEQINFKLSNNYGSDKTHLVSYWLRTVN